MINVEDHAAHLSYGTRNNMIRCIREPREHQSGYRCSVFQRSILGKGSQKTKVLPLWP